MIMNLQYIRPHIEVIRLETEQCFLNSSNVPGFEPGTDFDELLD